MEAINTDLSIALLTLRNSSFLRLKKLFSAIQTGSVVTTYHNAKKFFHELQQRKFDLIMFDIEMPGMSGKEILKKAGNDHCIIITSPKQEEEEKAIKCHPIDILIKPVIEVHLIRALEKAKKIILPRTGSKNKDTFQPSGHTFYLFHTGEGLVNILLSSILFVKTVKNSHRNLELFLKSGKKILIKGYSLESILRLTGFLLQPNRSELVAPDAIELIEGKSFIKLNNIYDNGKPLYSTLCLGFRKEFLIRFNSI